MQQIGYASTALEVTNLAVTAAVKTIVIAANNRQVVHIRNIGEKTCWIGTEANPPVAATQTGYPLGATSDTTERPYLGEGFTIQNPSTSVKLTVLCAAGEVTRLSIVATAADTP